MRLRNDPNLLSKLIRLAEEEEAAMFDECASELKTLKPGTVFNQSQLLAKRVSRIPNLTARKNFGSTSLLYLSRAQFL